MIQFKKILLSILLLGSFSAFAQESPTHTMTCPTSIIVPHKMTIAEAQELIPEALKNEEFNLRGFWNLESDKATSIVLPGIYRMHPAIFANENIVAAGVMVHSKGQWYYWEQFVDRIGCYYQHESGEQVLEISKNFDEPSPYQVHVDENLFFGSPYFFRLGSEWWMCSPYVPYYSHSFSDIDPSLCTVSWSEYKKSEGGV